MECLYEERSFLHVVNVVIRRGQSLQCRKLFIDKDAVVLANVTQGVNSSAAIKSH